MLAYYAQIYASIIYIALAMMQKELEELQPKLVTAQDENTKMMVVIEC